MIEHLEGDAVVGEFDSVVGDRVVNVAFYLFFLVGMMVFLCFPEAAFAGSHQKVNWFFALKF